MALHICGHRVFGLVKDVMCLLMLGILVTNLGWFNSVIVTPIHSKL